MKHQFEAKAQRQPGHEDRNSFFRKGIKGDWKNYFDEKCIQTFKKSNSGRWNRLLVRMGYEKSENWEKPYAHEAIKS